jgi:hypothetical protein
MKTTPRQKVQATPHLEPSRFSAFAGSNQRLFGCSAGWPMRKQAVLDLLASIG